MNDTDVLVEMAAFDAETLAKPLAYTTAVNGIRTPRDSGESAAAEALRLLAAQHEALSRKAERIQIALNASNAMNGVHERAIARLRAELEQAKLAPGPTGLTRAWSGYNDDECWFPAFADIRDAKAYAEAAFRVSCAELDAGEPGEIAWAERKARTDHLGYPDMWDLTSDVGGDGWVVCGALVHPDLASGLREQPIEQPEPDAAPQPQSPGQGVLPVETAGSATPSVTIVHNGAEHALPLRPGDFLGDLFATACDAFGLSESERQRLGLFNDGGVQIDTDVALGHVKPGDLLTLRPRIVRA